MALENDPADELESALLWARGLLRANSLSIKDIKPVFAFLLIWNAFEGKLFDNEYRLSVRTLSELARARTGTINEKVINDAYEFFNDRYFGTNGCIDKFNNLRLEKDPKKWRRSFLDNKTDKEFVRSVLIDSESSLLDKFTSILLVAHRFRNNLFHGLKYVDKLVEYQRPFIAINSVLKEIAESCPPEWRTGRAV